MLGLDVRYALRQLRKSPGFTITVVLTLALGIGANAAIFTLFDQVLLRMLPVENPRELVRLEWSGGFSGWSSAFGGNSPGHDNYFSYPMCKDLREQNSVFQGILAADKAGVGVSWHDQAESKDAEIVSGNYFQLLGLKPALGRLFTPQDETGKNANPVAVLSYDYWRTRFGAAGDIVGQTILVNGHPFTVVGVAPEHFDSAIGGYKPGVFVPVTMVEQAIPWRVVLDDLKNHHSACLTVVARLKPGVTYAQANAGLGPLWRTLRIGRVRSLQASIRALPEELHRQLAPAGYGRFPGFQPQPRRSRAAAHHSHEYGRPAGDYVRHQCGHAVAAACNGARPRNVNALCSRRAEGTHRRPNCWWKEDCSGSAGLRPVWRLRP